MKVPISYGDHQFTEHEIKEIDSLRRSFARTSTAGQFLFLLDQNISIGHETPLFVEA